MESLQIGLHFIFELQVKESPHYQSWNQVAFLALDCFTASVAAPVFSYQNHFLWRAVEKY